MEQSPEPTQPEAEKQLDLLDGAAYAEMIRTKPELADFFTEEDLAELAEFGPGDAGGDAMDFIFNMLYGQGAEDQDEVFELLRQLGIFE